MRVLQTAKAQEIAALIDQGVSIEREGIETPKPPPPTQPKPQTKTRGPGRPPGAKNKATLEKERAEKAVRTQAAAQTPYKSEAEKIVSKAKADESVVRDKKEPPDFTEWQSFIGEVILHWFSVAFVAIAFRGIPYHDVMTQEDYEDIQLDDDELGAVARPFAHMLTHSGLNTKYGRAIMNSRDSIEATVILVMWGARVRRISQKYRRGWNEYVQANGVNNVTRIDRPDRIRDSESTDESEIPAPLPGISRAAFGHGFN